MRRLIWRFVRDLALLPVIAFVVYQLVARLPVQRDDDAKQGTATAVQQELRERLCLDRWDGFVCPWQDLVSGRSLVGDGGSALYDGRHIARALAGSLRIGAMALGLALGLAALFAALSVKLGASPLGALFARLPAIVYATPSFLVALVVARYAGVSFDEEKARFEPVVAAVMSVGPGIFLGVVLRDALFAELTRPYVRTARAKGCSPARALIVHALPNALPALLDTVTPVATALLAGSFVAERLFNVTYLGFLYVEAARTRQLGVGVVTTTLFAALLVLVSFSVALIRRWIDPLPRGEAPS
jgi:oligopeptide transport system permease protein